MSLRIAMISEHASPIASTGGIDSGGQNVYVAQVARNLVAQGHQVDVFTRRDDPMQVETRCPDGVRVVHVPAGPPRYVRKEELLPYMEEFARWMLRRMQRDGAYDVVHANFFMSGLVACLIREAAGVPFAITFHALGRVRRLHQGASDQFPPERLQIEDRIMASADRIIAECPQDEEDQIHLYGAEPAKIRIAPCGFDTEEFYPIEKRHARGQLGLNPDELLILQIGRMVPRKGVDDAIRGFARLVRRHRVAARMLVVGGETYEPDPVQTPEIGRLQQVARAEGVADRVLFTGRRDHNQLRLYYSAADVFVTVPWYEPFGITPLEAMACATPVIGSRVGGIQHTVRDGRTGFLVSPKSPDELGQRLATLCRDHTRRRVMSWEAFHWVRRQFTWPCVTAQIADILEETAAAPLRSQIQLASLAYSATGDA